MAAQDDRPPADGLAVRLSDIARLVELRLSKRELQLVLAVLAQGGCVEANNARLAEISGMHKPNARSARRQLEESGLMVSDGKRLSLAGIAPIELTSEGGSAGGLKRSPQGDQNDSAGGSKQSPKGDQNDSLGGSKRSPRGIKTIPQGDQNNPPQGDQNDSGGSNRSPYVDQLTHREQEAFAEKGSEGESGSLYLSIYAPKKDEELKKGRADREKEPLSPFERLFAAWNNLIDELPAGLARRPVRHRTASPAQRRAVAERLAEGYSEELLKLAMERYVETAATPGMFSPGFGRWRLQDLLSRREPEDWVESLLQADWRKRFGPKDDLSAAAPPTLRRAEWTKPTQLSLGLEEPDAEVGGEDEDLLNGILKGWLQACPTAKALSIFEAQDFAMRLEDEFGAEALSKLPEVLQRLAARAEEASIPAKTILKLTMRDDTFAALISRRTAGISKGDRITREIEERTQRVIDQRARRKGK